MSEAKSQNYLRHGIGGGIGWDKHEEEFLTSWGLEYELSILNQSKGFESGIVTGIGVSFPTKKGYQDDNWQSSRYDVTYDPREFGVYVKGGYKFRVVSIGVNAGFAKEVDRELVEVSNSQALIGGWAGIEPARFLNLMIGYDTFRGINVGVLFYPNKIRSNRR